MRIYAALVCMGWLSTASNATGPAAEDRVQDVTPTRVKVDGIGNALAGSVRVDVPDAFFGEALKVDLIIPTTYAAGIFEIKDIQLPCGGTSLRNRDWRHVYDEKAGTIGPEYSIALSLTVPKEAKYSSNVNLLTDRGWARIVIRGNAKPPIECAESSYLIEEGEDHFDLRLQRHDETLAMDTINVKIAYAKTEKADPQTFRVVPNNLNRHNRLTLDIFVAERLIHSESIAVAKKGELKVRPKHVYLQKRGGSPLRNVLHQSKSEGRRIAVAKLGSRTIPRELRL